MMRTHKQNNVAQIVLTALFICGFLFAGQNEALTELRQKEIIDELCRKIENIYPFPEIAKQTVSGLQEYFKQGKYRNYTDKEFCQAFLLSLWYFSLAHYDVVCIHMITNM